MIQLSGCRACKSKERLLESAFTIQWVNYNTREPYMAWIQCHSWRMKGAASQSCSCPHERNDGDDALLIRALYKIVYHCSLITSRGVCRMEGIILAFHPQPLNFSSPQPCEASKTCKPKEEVSLPPKIIITPHERENPSQQDFGTHPNQPLWEDVPSSWWNNGAKTGKYLSPESCRTQRNEGRSAPLISINIQSLQCSINNSASTSSEIDAIINWRRSSPPYLELNNSIHEKETPTTHGDNGVCQVKITPAKWKEVLQPPHVKCLPVTDVANTLDPHEDQHHQLFKVLISQGLMMARCFKTLQHKKQMKIHSSTKEKRVDPLMSTLVLKHLPEGVNILLQTEEEY